MIPVFFSRTSLGSSLYDLDKPGFFIDDFYQASFTLFFFLKVTPFGFVAGVGHH